MAIKGIEKLIQKFAVQTATYWRNAGPDGFGGYTFDDPIDILCRWEGKSEIKMTNTGQYYASAASLMTNHEIAVDDYVRLGSVTELTGIITNPKAIEGAFAIIQVDKVPMVRKTDEFVRTGYLFDYAK